MRRKILVMVCLLVIALMVASTVPVGAVKPTKPPKPPPDDGSDPTGTIFYSNTDANDDFNIYSMNADGSSMTLQVQWTAGMDAMSFEKHKDGHYWYVGFILTDGTHPDGTYQSQLWAIRDDDAKSVQLMDDTSMAYDSWNGPPCWLSGDSYLSWAALKWAEDDTIAEAGIYKAAISFDTTDDDPQLSTPTLVWSSGTYSHGGGTWYTPEVSCPNWSPDGTKVVMASSENGGTVVDLTDIDEPVETVLGESIYPKWSPDGTKLAYSYNHKEVRVMNPDGTGDTELTSIKSSKKRSKDIMELDWSPDSKFLMYTVVTFSLMTWDRSADIFTIGVDGTGNTCLTNGINGPDWFWGRDWR